VIVITLGVMVEVDFVRVVVVVAATATVCVSVAVVVAPVASHEQKPSTREVAMFRTFAMLKVYPEALLSKFLAATTAVVVVVDVVSDSTVVE
jgi:hypothetical protein